MVKEIFANLQSNWIRVLLSLIVLMVFMGHASFVLRIPFIDQLENIAYDQHLMLTMPDTVDDSVVIVDIDEVSLTAEGRWPWPRNKLAQLIEQLFERYEVSIVGFDIVFAEPDDSSGLGVLEALAVSQLKDNDHFQSQLQVIRPTLDYDGIFAETIQKYDIVLGYYFSLGSNANATQKTGTLPEPLFEKSVFQGKKVQFLTASGYGANLDARP